MSLVGVAPGYPARVSVGITIPVKCLQMARRRALHHSLPNPMEIRFTVASSTGGSASIIIPAKSSVADLDLPSRASQQPAEGSPRTLLGFAYADDTIAEGRISGTVYHLAQDDAWEVSIAPHTTITV
jgi:hypothetical protein